MKRVLVYLLMFLVCRHTYGQTLRYEVCVYGATASGVMAAVQASRMGKKTVLISQDNHVGGMATSGLTATDINKHAVVGGLPEEFYKRIYEYYLSENAWRNQTREEFMKSTLKRTFSGKNDKRRMQWVYESGVGEKIMKQMLEESGVKVLYSSRISLSEGVMKKGTDISEIRTENGLRIKSKMFIDASYEGDLMASAGVSYRIGREGISEYGEPLAGIHKFDVIKTSPYLNKKDGALIPYVAPSLYGTPGEGDDRTQAYCYRVTLTDDPQNMVPFSAPKNYNPALYEMVLRKIEMEDDILLKNIITFTPMPNRKTDTNHLDFFGASFDYPASDYSNRRKIAELHKDYACGMLWFLGNDPRVPEGLRNEMKRWGWAKDEFTDNGNFPHQMYIREARRMVGEYVMTQDNVQSVDTIANASSVGMGSYTMDCHYVSYVAEGDSVIIEGGLFTPTKPYTISYYSLVPKASECTNLLVPVCLSASHVAYTSIRMEPVYMVLGQSSAAAAVLSIDSRCPVQSIDYQKLKEILLAEGQVINDKTKKQ